MPENRRVAFRFGKEFTEEQFKEAQAAWNLGEAKTIRRLLSFGYTLLRKKEENIAKVKQQLEEFGLSPRELLV